MIKYAKIIDEETKLCEVGLGTNNVFYASIGMKEMDVEQAYNGQWYVKGHAPAEPETDKQARVREIRNQMLEKSDKYMISDFPLTDEERYQMKLYRQYLRDYTKQKDWWENLPDNFADWRANIAKVDKILKESTKTKAEQAEPETAKQIKETVDTDAESVYNGIITDVA